MHNSFSLLRYLLLASIFLITGCGGGGSQNTSPINTNPTPGGGVTITKVSLAQSENTVVSATFTKIDGTPAAGVTVDFATTLGTINPATATTNAQGQASCTLMAGTTAGQGQVAASATYDGKTYVKTANFQVNLPVLHLSPITLGASTLSYGGTTSVSVTVLDTNNNVYTGQEVEVYFTSTASGSGTATISSPVRSVNGVATTTYKGLTFTGTDTVTATISGSSVTSTITITPLSAGSITFVSATPNNLALKGTGGINKSEVSTVVFKVLDSSGAVRPNTTVDFILNTTVGGISLSSASGSTGTDGTVSVQVYSGIIATPVRVTATIRGTSISTQSEQLVISTGLPAQDGFSISLSTLNPEAYDYDGITVNVTARLSDHFHNPVPDGTLVYFTTSGGSIQPSCTTVGGACTVIWTSQNPRPLVSLGAKQDGRAVILAYAVGEENFLDTDGNGKVSDSCAPIANGTGLPYWRKCGEFYDYSEAFRDDNEDNIRNATETFIDFNKDNLFNGPDGIFNGVLQVTPVTPQSKHIFSNSVLVMATSQAKITGSNIILAPNSSTNMTVTISDMNGNTVPAGTTVEFTLVTTFPGTGSALLIMPAYDKYIFPNNSSATGTNFTLSISNNATTTAPKGYVMVKVTSSAGLVTTKYIYVN